MGKKAFRIPMMLLMLLTAVSCGNFIFPDAEGLEMLRSAKSAVREISLEGKVTDSAGQPLPDIRVVVIGRFVKDPQMRNGVDSQPIDTLFTNSSGNYLLERRFVASTIADLQIDADDPSGAYAPGSVVVTNANIGAVAPTISLYHY